MWNTQGAGGVSSKITHTHLKSELLTLYVKITCIFFFFAYMHCSNYSYWYGLNNHPSFVLYIHHTAKDCFYFEICCHLFTNR